MLCQRTRPAELERRRGLHDLPALRLRRRPALPHDGGLQPQAEAAATGRALKEALQALGTDLAEGSGLGARSGVSHAKEVGYQKTEMLQRICGSPKNVS